MNLGATVESYQAAAISEVDHNGGSVGRVGHDVGEVVGEDDRMGVAARAEIPDRPGPGENVAALFQYRP